LLINIIGFIQYIRR